MGINLGLAAVGAVGGFWGPVLVPNGQKPIEKKSNLPSGPKPIEKKSNFNYGRGEALSLSPASSSTGLLGPKPIEKKAIYARPERLSKKKSN